MEKGKLIFECYAGSHLYGTNTPESDIDIRGVILPYLSTLLDPFTNFEQQEFPNEDKVHFSLRKFFQLAENSNPNIVELLFVPESKTIISSPEWNKIIENRYIFISQVCRYSFSGYADAQLKRIKLHRSWILNPPKKEPIRSDYGLKDSPLFGSEKLQNLIHSPIECIKEEYREYALAEQSYHSARENWNKYINWKQTRNPKRYAIEEKYHLDLKMAMHLYRLLSECKELLETGNITLPRPDKDFLLEVRNGKFTYDELMIESENVINTINSVQSSLPKKPDIKKITELFLSFY